MLMVMAAGSVVSDQTEKYLSCILIVICGTKFNMKNIVSSQLKIGKLYWTDAFCDLYFEEKLDIVLCVTEEQSNIGNIY